LNAKEIFKLNKYFIKISLHEKQLSLYYIKSPNFMQTFQYKIVVENIFDINIIFNYAKSILHSLK